MWLAVEGPFLGLSAGIKPSEPNAVVLFISQLSIVKPQLPSVIALSPLFVPTISTRRATRPITSCLAYNLELRAHSHVACFPVRVYDVQTQSFFSAYHSSVPALASRGRRP